MAKLYCGLSINVFPAPSPQTNNECQAIEMTRAKPAQLSLNKKQHVNAPSHFKLSMWFAIRDGFIFPQTVVTLGALTVIEKHGSVRVAGYVGGYIRRPSRPKCSTSFRFKQVSQENWVWGALFRRCVLACAPCAFAYFGKCKT